MQFLPTQVSHLAFLQSACIVFLAFPCFFLRRRRTKKCYIRFLSVHATALGKIFLFSLREKLEDLIDDAGQWYELSQHGHVAESLAMFPDVATRMYVLTKHSCIEFLLRIWIPKLSILFRLGTQSNFPGFATCRRVVKVASISGENWLKKHNYL